MTCPFCGGTSVAKARGLQGLGEVALAAILTVCFIIPGVIYYVWRESIPYCSGCGRRVTYGR